MNGTVLKVPLSDVNVANEWERGLLGIAVVKKIEVKENLRSLDKYVFLLFTEGSGKKMEMTIVRDRIVV